MEELEKYRKTANERLVYPSNLGEDGMYPFMKIMINERALKGDEGFTTTIYTYIPIGIFQNDGISYGTLERGLTGQVMETILGNNNYALTREDLIAAASRGTSYVGDFVGFDVTGGYNVAVAKQGIAMNPSAVVTFDTTEIRQFDINLKFISETKEESAEIGKIINRIQNFMYPEKIGKFALQYPATFFIEFYAPDENLDITRTPLMPIYAPAYCTGLQTTYNPSHSSFHPDGTPVEVDVQLSFRETRALVREDLHELYKDAGISISDAPNEGNKLSQFTGDEKGDIIAGEEQDVNDI